MNAHLNQSLNFVIKCQAKVNKRRETKEGDACTTFKVLLVEPRFLLLHLEFLLCNHVGQHLPVDHSLQPALPRSNPQPPQPTAQSVSALPARSSRCAHH